MSIINAVNDIVSNVQKAINASKLNWKQNIDYNQYNPNIERQFIRSHDYDGCADYLSHFRQPNAEEQKQFMDEIANLRLLGRQYKALYSNANKTQKDALNFFEAFNYGDYEYLNDDTNEYNKKYLDSVKNLGFNIEYGYPTEPTIEPPTTYYDTSTNTPTTISVSFNNIRKSYGLWGYGFDWMSKDEEKDFFRDFCESTGYSESSIKQLLGEGNFYNNDGIITIKADKTNFDAIRFLTKVNEWADNNGYTTDDVWYNSLDKYGEVVSDNTGVIAGEIRDIRTLLTDADSQRENLIKTAGGGEQVYSTTTMPFVNEYQAQLYQLASSGQISWEAYDHQLKADNDIYDAKLLGNDFGNLRIFKSTGGDMVEMSDNLERQNLKGLVSSAIKEGRVHRMAAIAGGEYGYYLEIDAVREKGDAVYDDGDARNTITLFFPGLFSKTTQTIFDHSTEGRTIKEMSSMQQYGYEYELPNGDTIMGLGNNGALYKNKADNKTREINREEVKKYIEESIVVEQGATSIENRMYNTDGTLRKGYDPRVDAMKLAVQMINDQEDEQFTIDDVFNPDGTIKINKEDSNRIRDEHISKAGDVYQMIITRIFNTLKSDN